MYTYTDGHTQREREERDGEGEREREMIRTLRSCGSLWLIIRAW